MALVKEEVSNRELRMNIESLKSDKEKYFSLIQKTLEKKPVFTYEEVHHVLKIKSTSKSSTFKTFA